MLTSPAATATAAARPRPAYRSFRATVRRLRRLTPHFTRVTFGGEELAGFGTAGLDQRLKVVLPLPGTGFDDFPGGEDWYGTWRELPAERRNPFRTYTIRAVRPELREVDVDFVAHGDAGPGSAWASRARPGDEVVLVGPDELSEGRTIGIDWRPGEVEIVLLAGDETAAPAICAILESLPADASGAAIIEVPGADDVLEVRAPAGVEVRWLPRTPDQVHGERLVPAVRDWVAGTCRSRDGADPADAAAGIASRPLAELEAAADADGVLWDVPEGTSLDGDCYAWLAGEASVITALRRFLVRDAGLDRRRVAFMGYWRRGRAELA
ncbi:siderophore-interacting protein [Agromyces aurantiacus]|uniref:Siderophore-interacting protein n=1 Tax=Agromyces aurantiacus TaxID=165814 RepID=A0ABV9R5Z8_9MICO|nr:siderophore-interacting protein [Agromyces aurantiacus]MBM7504260.1 NADPH-dependent ferric siderophore reductase [Agromyces aurantiacus]